MATGKDKLAGPNEIDVLLSEVEIGPYKIKPWSFGRFKKVYPVLIGMIPAFQGLGLTAENLQEELAARGLEIVGAVLPAVSLLVAATLDIPEAEVDEMDFEQAAVIGLTIIAQNVGRIKNSLPLIMGQFKNMVRAA
jgi:hypothetical protein